MTVPDRLSPMVGDRWWSPPSLCTFEYLGDGLWQVCSALRSATLAVGNRVRPWAMCNCAVPPWWLPVVGGERGSVSSKVEETTS